MMFWLDGWMEKMQKTKSRLKNDNKKCFFFVWGRGIFWQMMMMIQIQISNKKKMTKLFPQKENWSILMIKYWLRIVNKKKRKVSGNRKNNFWKEENLLFFVIIIRLMKLIFFFFWRETNLIRVIHKRSLSSSVLETIRPISQNQLKIDRLITFTQSVSEKIICHQQYYYIVCNGEFEPKKSHYFECLFLSWFFPTPLPKWIFFSQHIYFIIQVFRFVFCSEMMMMMINKQNSRMEMKSKKTHRMRVNDKMNNIVW